MSIVTESNYFPGLDTRKIITFREPPESETIFENISANSRPNSKRFHGVKLGPNGVPFHEKNLFQKSRATVPLNSRDLREFWYDMFHNL